jgi:hypothetical protein
MGQYETGYSPGSIASRNNAAATTAAAAAAKAQAEAARIQALKDAGQNPDGSPIRPTQTAITGPDGQLLDQFKYSTQLLDPSKLEGYNMVKNLAQTAVGQSDYAKTAQAGALAQRGQAMDAASGQAAGALNAGMGNLAMRGGMASGARERMATAGARGIAEAGQGAYQNYGNNLQGILSQDVTNKNNAINTFANAEGQIAGKNLDLTNSQNQYNLGNVLKQNDNTNTWNMDTYKEQLGKWSAEKQAEASRPSGGGGGCCFIFLEARYGNGTMDNVVRRFRDAHMTNQNKRGYYKLSEVLVPLMRSSKIIKILVRVFMTDPLVAYGKAYYGGNKLGFLFTPVKNFWLKTFDYLGKEHKFIRENGEVI